MIELMQQQVIKIKKKKKKNLCSLEHWTYISLNKAQPESLETTEKNGLS